MFGRGTTLRQFLSKFPVVSKVRVQQSEMQISGHINNTKYFDYLESARENYFQFLFSKNKKLELDMITAKVSVIIVDIDYAHSWECM